MLPDTFYFEHKGLKVIFIFYYAHKGVSYFTVTHYTLGSPLNCKFILCVECTKGVFDTIKPLKV